MNTRILALGIALLGVGSAARAVSMETARSGVQGWPEASKLEAEALIGKYGAPDLATSDRLEWINRGPFRKVAVRAVADEGKKVEQTIRYATPRKAKTGAMAFKSCVVTPDKTEREMTAFCDTEANGFLALNKADEIMTGREAIPQAQASFTRDQDLRASGKSTSDSERLNFKVKSPLMKVYSPENGSYIELD